MISVQYNYNVKLWRPFSCLLNHDDVIKWKYFPRYWPFVRGIHRSPVNSPHICQWRGVLMFSLICARINRWVNNGEAGDLRRYRAHYDVIVMAINSSFGSILWLVELALKRKFRHLGEIFVIGCTESFHFDNVTRSLTNISTKWHWCFSIVSSDSCFPLITCDQQLVDSSTTSQWCIKCFQTMTL